MTYGFTEYLPINKQINAELYSAYLYLGMASRCTEMNLKGMANWLYVQAQEEMTHAMKFYRFVLDRAGHPVLPAIEGVSTDWKAPLEMFAAAYEHEKLVTGMINKIVDVALAERDHATASMLNWFVDEQVEEETNTSEVTEKLKLLGDSKDGLLMLDKELSTRVFVDGTQPAGKASLKTGKGLSKAHGAAWAGTQNRRRAHRARPRISRIAALLGPGSAVLLRKKPPPPLRPGTAGPHLPVPGFC